MLLSETPVSRRPSHFGINMRRLLSVLALLLAVNMAAAAEKLPAKFERGYPPQLPHAEVETYRRIGDAEMKLYVHKPSDWKVGDRRPAIVFFFGGGWTNGSPSQFRYQCEYLASRGVVAVTADYRVASRQQVKAIDCVHDAVAALRYMRSNAGRLGVDPNKIVASGGSAGGHLAACLGVIDGLDDGTANHADVSYRPNALVLFNPALQFGESPGIPLTSERTGVDPQAISPYHHVKAGAPPTILFFGTADSMFESAQAFKTAMDKAGNRCELDAYEGLPHGFFNAGRNDNKPFIATLEKTDRFLTSLGYLSGPPTVIEFFEVE